MKYHKKLKTWEVSYQNIIKEKSIHTQNQVRLRLLFELIWYVSKSDSQYGYVHVLKKQHILIWDS